MEIEVSAVDLVEAGPSSSNDKDERVIMDSNPNNSTTVTFREDENEYVVMTVNDNEFPGIEMNTQSDEEDGEISFNNNSIRREETMTMPDFHARPKHKHNEIAESEEERETCIINKTVAKLQQIITAGGFLKQDAKHAIQDISTSEQGMNSMNATIEYSNEGTEKKEARAKLITNRPQNKSIRNKPKSDVMPTTAAASNSESTIYHNAVQPACLEMGNITAKDIETALNTVEVAKLGGNPLRESSDDDVINTSDGSTQDNQIAEFLNNARNELCLDFSGQEINSSQNVRMPTAASATSGPHSEVHVVANHRGRSAVQNQHRNQSRETVENAEDNMTRMIREAEASKACILNLQGTVDNSNFQNVCD